MVSSNTREIFDIIHRKHVPDCCLEWFDYLLKEQIWHLEVIPFHVLDCKIVKVEDDREIFECGYWRMKRDWSYQGFKELQIEKGCHQHLHQAVHCLHDKEIGFDKINIEQPFKCFKVDVEGEIEKEKQYIIVELGELSSLGKFRLVQDEIVKEFWFDRKNRMHCLSQTKTKIRRDFTSHIFKYYKSHCDCSHLWSCTTYGAFDCLGTLRLGEDMIKLVH
jgi:hypothetical protein